MLAIITITIDIVLKAKATAPEKTPGPALAATNAERRFLSFWPILWLSWFTLYMLLALKAAGVALMPSATMNATLNLINNTSGVLLFSMYFEMAFKTESDGEARSPTRLWIPASMILFVFFAFEMIWTHSAAQEFTGRVTGAFSLFSGIFVGICAALLATKLASRSLGIPFWAIAFLAFYAVIQPVFPLISKPADSIDRHLSQFFVMVAFYGKVLLLAIVHWARDSNRLWYYMVTAAERYRQEEDEELGLHTRLVARALVKGENNEGEREGG